MAHEILDMISLEKSIKWHFFDSLYDITLIQNGKVSFSPIHSSLYKLWLFFLFLYPSLRMNSFKKGYKNWISFAFDFWSLSEKSKCERHTKKFLLCVFGIHIKIRTLFYWKCMVCPFEFIEGNCVRKSCILWNVLN